MLQYSEVLIKNDMAFMVGLHKIRGIMGSSHTPPPIFWHFLFQTLQLCLQAEGRLNCSVKTHV
jgi:hypothetical protein